MHKKNKFEEREKVLARKQVHKKKKRLQYEKRETLHCNWQMKRHLKVRQRNKERMKTFCKEANTCTMKTGIKNEKKIRIS